MKEFNLQTGKIGENIAKEYLKKKGYKILAQNFKTKYAEIDLLARRNFGEGGVKREVLVFVEVRTKRGEMFGSPEETIDQRKLKQVHFAARIYCAMKKWTGSCRIDTVCIVLGENNVAKKINHYENII